MSTPNMVSVIRIFKHAGPSLRCLYDPLSLILARSKHPGLSYNVRF